MEGLPVGHVVAVGAAALSERTRRARLRMVSNQPVAHDGNKHAPTIDPVFLYITIHGLIVCYSTVHHSLLIYITSLS